MFVLTATAPTDIYTLSLHDALPISERRRQRAVPRELPLLELHLPVAFDAEEFHCSFETTFSHTSSPGWNGTRASTGIPNSAASSSAAFPTNGPPTMFSTTPSSVAFPSLAARSARRTASRDSGVGMVTASTA